MKPGLLLSAILITLCSFVALAAEKKEYKFGNITIEQLKNTSCPIDSNAHAFFIFNIGRCYYTYEGNFQTRFEQHFRLKILDKAGVSQASFVIPYLNINSKNRVFGNLKAFTYNFENGEIVKTELNKNEVFDEKTIHDWHQISSIY